MEENIYAAGLFDGEGTVTLSTANGKFRYPVVSVSSTTLCLLEFLQTRYGGHVSKHKTTRNTMQLHGVGKRVTMRRWPLLRKYYPISKNPKNAVVRYF